MTVEPTVKPLQDVVIPWVSMVSWESGQVGSAYTPAWGGPADHRYAALTVTGFERTHVWTNQISPG